MHPHNNMGKSPRQKHCLIINYPTKGTVFEQLGATRKVTSVHSQSDLHEIVSYWKVGIHHRSCMQFRMHVLIKPRRSFEITVDSFVKHQGGKTNLPTNGEH